MKFQSLLFHTMAFTCLLPFSTSRCMEKQYAVPGSTWIERKQALASVGVDVTNMLYSNAYILGIMDPSLNFGEAAFRATLNFEPKNTYSLPGDTPTQRLATLQKTGANVSLLKDSEKRILGLPPAENTRDSTTR